MIPQNILKKLPQMKWEQVGPEQATRYLEKCIGNRRQRGSNITALARDIKADRFLPIHQGIAFDSEGRLIDGQHRLKAIVIANKPVILPVWRGLRPEAKFVIDNNAPRDSADILGYLGFKLPGTGSPCQFVGILKQLIRGKSSLRKMSNDELHALAHEYKEAICWVMEQFPRAVRHVAVAPVMAAICRAYILVPKKRARIARFATILSTSIANQDDKSERAVIDFRNGLLGNAANRDHQSVVNTYLKTGHILRLFLEGKELVGRLSAPAKDPFEWPEELVPEVLKSTTLSASLEEQATKLRNRKKQVQGKS